MSLLGILAVTLGPSIAKAVAKAWLKDQSVLGEILPDIVDLLKDSAMKESERRQAARQIEAVGEQVVTQMRVAFDNELNELNEADRTAITVEVIETLAQARISAELVVGYGLDPAKLTRYLLETRQVATRTLSSDEAQIYKRLLAEISRAVIKIATELADFEGYYYATTLQGLEKILKGLVTLLSYTDIASTEFQTRYLNTVRRELDRLEVIGEPQLDPVVRRQSLIEAYTTPVVESGNTIGPVDQMLSMSRRRLVIRGEAGLGKSTLLQWIGVHAARQDFPPHLGNWNNCVPFFIRLRERVNRGFPGGFPTPEVFPSLVAPMVAGDNMPRGWVHQLLEIGRALVLVDGVDELPREQRGSMLNLLSQLVADYPLARYIVTSRPSVLKADEWPEWQEWTQREGFMEATIQLMTPDQINNFVDQWHHALAVTTQDEVERTGLLQLAASLKQQLQKRLPLQQLAANPLLCSMICALHKDRRQNLPAEQITLFKECIELLLNRDAGRQINFESDHPELTDLQKLALVQSFAYWLMRNNYSEVEVEEADKQFADKLPLMNLPEDVTGIRVRRFFVARTGLLREPVEGRVAFTHRSFQEYLAAQRAIKERDLNLLRDNALNDQWREMIILVAGMADPKDCEALLKKLVALAKKRKPDKRFETTRF